MAYTEKTKAIYEFADILSLYEGDTVEITPSLQDACKVAIRCIKKCEELNKFAEGYYNESERKSEYDTSVNKDLGILGGV